MRLWTMLLSLALAAVIVGSAFAQEKKEGKKGRRGPSFEEMAGTAADAKLTCEKFVEARTKNAPVDKKEQATTRAKGMFDRLCKLVDKGNPPKELTKEQYTKAVEAFRASFKGKKRGENK